MRVLVITRGVWSDSNNTGGTMTNLFSDMPNDCTFYSLYCRSENPDNPIAKQSFKIGEYELFKNLLHHSPVGSLAPMQTAGHISADEQKIYRRGRRFGKSVTQPLRELLWLPGTWKSASLDTFLQNTQPDVIFMPAFDSLYTYRLLWYVQKKTGARTVLFHEDDNYSLPPFFSSPLYWIHRFVLRSYMRKAVREAALNFCITDMQCADYKKRFGRPFYLLTKSADFQTLPPLPKTGDGPLQMVYTGNIDTGRAHSLALLAQAVQKINRDALRVQLHIYSGIVKNEKFLQNMTVRDMVFFHGAVSPKEVAAIQSRADILVFTEGLDRYSKYRVRQSFSSKLVDYFATARCIFAVGPAEIAPIAHLERHDAAIVAHNAEEVFVKLQDLTENPDLLTTYARQAWECGAQYHNSRTMRSALYEALKKVAQGQTL